MKLRTILILTLVILSWALKAQNFSRADYDKPQQYYEEEIQISEGDYAITATLMTPTTGTNFPVAILVHGSGPNDKDGTAINQRPLRDLAVGLASKGIATIRYDKRTKTYGLKMVLSKATLTTKEEVTEDVHFAIEAAKKQKALNPNKIYVIGHSLGAMMAPRIGKENPDLAGIILMAGPARKLEDIVLEQYIYLQATDAQIEAYKKQLALLKSGDYTNETPANELPLGLPPEYWKDLSSYNQVNIAQELTIPILILQGERDYQVTMEDYKLWQDALSEDTNAEFKSYPKLNHLFTEGEGASTPQEYQNALNIPLYVIEDISNFIQ